MRHYSGPADNEIRPSISMMLPGSPIAALADRIDRQLSDDAIACACPHPATATELHLPSGLLGCHDCVSAIQEALDRQQDPVCTLCGQVAPRTATWQAGPLSVVARICDTCGSIGNAPQSMN